MTIIAISPDRIFGFPSHIEKPLYLFDQDNGIKSHPAYAQAKAGFQEAAFRLVADLANYVQLHGGHVENVVALVNAGRDKRLTPCASVLRKLKSRYENDIKEIFGIDVAALTANEAGYLIGFRSADEIRNRRIKANQETNLRLRAKGVEREI